MKNNANKKLEVEMNSRIEINIIEDSDVGS
jgi:hypothetical protein